MAARKDRLGLLSSSPYRKRRNRPRFIPLVLFLGFVFSFSLSAANRGHWSELNIGPFYIDYQGDAGAAREDLNQLEQLRWVLGGLLESSDLRSLWPIRFLIRPSSEIQAGEFVSQNGQYLFVWPAGTHPPLDQVAGILLDDNTPRLPAEVESGLRELFSTLEAHGSHVTWGSPPAHPDLAWARMQLFATRFEYTSSFHIFVMALKSGSSFRAAERNAFSKDPDALDREAAANLAAGHWEPVSVSGRPLDPKRDFGEHSLDDAAAEVYLADTRRAKDPKAAEAAYKAAVEAGGTAAALGYERLNLFNDAIRAGSHAATAFVGAAQDLPPDKAVSLLKTAAQMNPQWAKPIYLQAELTQNPKDKEALLKKAATLDPRATAYWVELARFQTGQGESTAAQGTWSRAADSAATPDEREKIQQERDASEQARLDAAEEAARREREQAHLDDQRAQQAQDDRVKSAEARANAALEQQAGNAKVDNAVPWDATVPKKPPVSLSGRLVSVDCGDTVSLTILGAGQKTFKLTLPEKPKDLACGAQKPEPRIQLHYRPGAGAAGDAGLINDYKIW